MGEATAVLERLRGDAIKVLDLRFTDLVGRQRHLALEASAIDARLLDEGILIDGSPIPGWREVTEADILMRPDLGTAWIDPFAAQPTLALICDGCEPATGHGYERDPRSTALRAEAFLASTTIADRVTVASEVELFILDELKVETGPLGCAAAAALARPAGPGGPGFVSAPPDDPAVDLRAEIATIMATIGIPGIRHAHGGSAGLAQLVLPAAGLTIAADRLQHARSVAHMVAASYGKEACFLPQPLPAGAGAGLILQLALWRGERTVFAGQGYADLSPTCLAFTAGIMAHAEAIAAFTNPSTNSYRRLAPGAEAPMLVAYAAHNRSTALRIPYAARPEGKRIEARFPDPSANPYLAMTAILMAGLDGIERKLDPGDPVDRNLYDLPAVEANELPQLPRTLDAALDALEADHDFLTRGEVMPHELIEAYVRIKRAEAAVVARTPHPMELALYRGW